MRTGSGERNGRLGVGVGAQPLVIKRGQNREGVLELTLRRL